MNEGSHTFCKRVGWYWIFLSVYDVYKYGLTHTISDW